jgi:hypothetical protein
VAVPNDAPETGDGSTVTDEVRQSLAQMALAMFGVLVLTLGGLAVAARRSRL